MSSSKIIWISGAESCNIWNENFEVLHKFEQGPVLDIAFNQDGNNVAYIPKLTNQIVTASIGIKNQIITLNQTTFEEGEVTALGFCNDLLLAGTSSGTILLWDPNKQKIIRKYEGVEKSPICRIQSNTSIIAAGHNGGSIQVYGMKTGQPMGHYLIANSSGLRDLKMSSIKTSLMAAAFNSGTVAAWNTHSNKGNTSPVVEFPAAHQSPATAVALSPITDILMVSGGLDKNVVLYDLPKKRILKKIEVDSPVSAIEFHPDGTSLVVGTTRGKLVTYDLRSISTPIQSIVAHTSSVSKLICRLVSLKSKGESGFPKKPSTLPISSSKQDIPTLTLPLTANEESNKFSRFPFSSPRSEPQSVSTPLNPVDLNALTDFPALGIPNTSHDAERKNSSLFSPIKGETSADLLSSPSLATSPVLKLSGKDCKEYPDLKTLQSEITALSNAGDDCETSSIFPAPATISSPANQTKDAQDDIQPPKHTNQIDSTVDFQADFIRRIVHDVEDNLREVLRRRFGDLIIQSAQQFLTLQNELEELKKQIQDKSSLEEEVKQLRNEVNQLRNLY